MKATTLAILVCAVGLARGAEVVGAGGPQNLVELLGSRINVRVIQDATVVRVCSVRPFNFGKASAEKIPDVSHASDRGNFLTLGPEHVARLKKLVLNEPAYDWNGLAHFCIPNYTIRAEFTAGREVVAVNFCFGCWNILFSKSEKPLGNQDLKAGAAEELFGFFLQVFPDDPILNDLARRRAQVPKH